MTQTTKPPKHLVREFFDHRAHAPDGEPPPSPEEIRRQLGWRMIPENGSLPQDQE